MPFSLKHTIHILTIDGEYSPTTGVSVSLVMLRETIRRLAHDENLSEDEALPCKYFDLIVGSGHGGWVALMLGRLGMPISRATHAYKNILERINDNSLLAEEKASLFELLIKKLVLRETGEDHMEEPRLEDDDSFQTHCRTAILASTIGNLSAPALFRTYHVRNNRQANCFVSEAIRASSTPRISPVTIDGERFVSSSPFGLSNPIDFALSEAAKIFPHAETQLIISIGSGHPGHTSFEPHAGPSYEEAAVSLARDAERKSEGFARRTDPSTFYYRFNVEQGFQAYFEDTENIQGTVLTHAGAYLGRKEVSERLDDAIFRLRGNHPQPPSTPEEHPTTFSLPTTIYPFTTAPPVQTYMYELYEAGYGLPLWDPEPLSGSKPVEIGDVGIITEDGGFETLFNATVAAEAQVREGYELPPTFQVLKIRDSDVQIRQRAIYPPYVMHGNIELRRQGLERPSFSSVNSRKNDFSLTLKATRGAAVIFKDPPTRITLRRSHTILDYIERHYKSWYHYYETDPDGPRRILDGAAPVFVTEIYQNSAWALGAWSNQDTPSFVTYSGSATFSGESITSLSGTWTPALTHNVKQGPFRADSALRFLRLRTPTFADLSGQSANQTSFVRGYTIGRRTRDLDPSHVFPHPTWLQNVLKLVSLGIPPVLRAAAEPRDPPQPPPPESGPAVSVAFESEGEELRDIRIDELRFRNPPRHPAEDVITVLLKASPQSHAVVVHDDDVANLIEYSKTWNLQSMRASQKAHRVMKLRHAENCAILRVASPYQGTDLPVKQLIAPASVVQVINHDNSSTLLDIMTSMLVNLSISTGKRLTMETIKFEPTHLPHTQTVHYLLNNAVYGTGHGSTMTDAQLLAAQEAYSKLFAEEQSLQVLASQVPTASTQSADTSSTPKKGYLGSSLAKVVEPQDWLKVKKEIKPAAPEPITSHSIYYDTHITIGKTQESPNNEPLHAPRPIGGTQGPHTSLFPSPARASKSAGPSTTMPGWHNVSIIRKQHPAGISSLSRKVLVTKDTVRREPSSSFITNRPQRFQESKPTKQFPEETPPISKSDVKESKEFQWLDDWPSFSPPPPPLATKETLETLKTTHKRRKSKKRTELSPHLARDRSMPSSYWSPVQPSYSSTQKSKINEKLSTIEDFALLSDMTHDLGTVDWEDGLSKEGELQPLSISAPPRSSFGKLRAVKRRTRTLPSFSQPKLLEGDNGVRWPTKLDSRASESGETVSFNETTTGPGQKRTQNEWGWMVKSPLTPLQDPFGETHGEDSRASPAEARNATAERADAALYVELHKS